MRFETPATNGVVAWCLEVHDLWISKAIAGRSKDVEFCEAVADRGLVDSEELRRRLEAVAGLNPRIREAVLGRIPGE